ncbi:MAG: hypothetical protein GY827_02470 [Cytophagales bacterium]|nr:hypothetical protein [Cytophagales bacterium]
MRYPAFIFILLLGFTFSCKPKYSLMFHTSANNTFKQVNTLNKKVDTKFITQKLSTDSYSKKLRAREILKIRKVIKEIQNIQAITQTDSSKVKKNRAKRANDKVENTLKKVFKREKNKTEKQDKEEKNGEKKKTPTWQWYTALIFCLLIPPLGLFIVDSKMTKGFLRTFFMYASSYILLPFLFIAGIYAAFAGSVYILVFIALLLLILALILGSMIYSIYYLSKHYTYKDS